MKTAVSVPDPIFNEAERLAKRLKKSRSRLYSDAIAEYVARRSGDAVTEAMDRVLEAVGEQPDPWVLATSRNTLAKVEW